jgi:hypothetical protein
VYAACPRADRPLPELRFIFATQGSDGRRAHWAATGKPLSDNADLAQPGGERAWLVGETGVVAGKRERLDGVESCSGSSHGLRLMPRGSTVSTVRSAASSSRRCEHFTALDTLTAASDWLSTPDSAWLPEPEARQTR